MDLATGTGILTGIGTFTSVANLETWQIWVDTSEDIEVTYRHGLWQIAKDTTQDDNVASPPYLKPYNDTAFATELNTLGGYGYTYNAPTAPTYVELEELLAATKQSLAEAEGEPTLEADNVASE